MNEFREPLVSVIVPTRNSARFLVRCLESISAQTYPQIELIVVDNHSTDDTRDIASRYTPRVLVAGPERSAQVNAGVQAARGTYIYKVDSDFVLASDVIKACVDKMIQGFDAVVVHNTPDAGVSWIARVRKFEVDMYKYDISHSAARFIRKTTYQSLGGFTEEITAGEDYDFQDKINRAGLKTAFVEPEATHLGEPRSFWSHMVKYYWYGFDFVEYAKRNRRIAASKLSPLRWEYVKHWRRFARDPVHGLLFVVYSLVKFSFGSAGYVCAVVGFPHGRTTPATRLAK